MAIWEKTPPRLYNILTGFFPETSPKETWATNPRPLLCCGVAQDMSDGTYAVRVAYGTTQNLGRAHANDLVIGNLGILNQLGLKHPTRFVINSGLEMVCMPWTEEFFQPWSDSSTPIRGRLPEDMQRYVGGILARLPDLPQF